MKTKMKKIIFSTFGLLLAISLHFGLVQNTALAVDVDDLRNGLQNYWSFDYDQRDDGDLGATTEISVVNSIPSHQSSGCKISGCYDFCSSGGVCSDAGLIYSDNTLFDPANGSFSLSAWIKSSALNTDGWPILFRWTGDRFFGISSLGSNIVGHYRPGPDWYQADSSNIMNVGEWYHAVFVVNSIDNTAKLYVNGVLSAEVSFPSVLSTNPPQAMYIGKDPGYSTISGSVDEVAVWDRTLNQDEIDFLYNSGNGNSLKKVVSVDDLKAGIRGYWPLDEFRGGVAFDFSGNQNHGTVGSLVDQDQDGNVIGSYLFDDIDINDGTNAVVLPTHSDFASNNDDRTISLWFNSSDIDALSDHPGRGLYFAGAQDSAGTNVIVLSKDTAGGPVVDPGFIKIFNMNIHRPAMYSDPVPYVNGEWAHILITKERINSTLATNKIYYNGSLVGQANLNHGGSFTHHWIGCDYRHNRCATKEKIDDLAIWNRVLSTEEISFIYNSGNGNTLKSMPTAEGTGIPSDPYVIRTCTELQNIEMDLGGYFVLDNDIDCSDTVNWNAGEGFMPIASIGGHGLKRFRGVLDGQGYSINDLFIGRTTSASQALFGQIDGALIEDLGLINFTIRGNNHSGTLVANANNSTISRVVISGELISPATGGGVGWYVGGLVGNSNNTDIIESSTYTNINLVDILSSGGGYERGGIVGRMVGGSIVNSYARGAVNGNRSGGLVGQSSSSALIENSFSTGLMSGDFFLAGLIGSCDASTVVNNSYWDMESSGITDPGCGEGKTTAELHDQTTFSGWDFSGIWMIDGIKNDAYPYHQYNNGELPVLTSASHSQVPFDYATFTISVVGNYFVSDSVVRIDGNDLSTTYVDSMNLTAEVPAGLLESGTFDLVVYNMVPIAGVSNVLNFSVENPVPTLSLIAPDNVIAGALGFTMTVTGSNFIDGVSVVRFDGSEKSTTFIDANTLEATIPASDLLVSGDYEITVFNSAPGGGESLPQVFTIYPSVPSISSISPVSRAQNSADFTLTVYGAGFASNSVVRFDGVDRATAYNSSTTLSATILASDLTTLGIFPIEVFTPAPGGGLSVAENFDVVAVPVPPSSSGGVVLLPVQIANVYDISGAEILIDNALALRSENIKIRFEGFKNANQYIVSEDENFRGARWQSFVEEVDFRLSSGLGRKTLYFKFRNTQNYSSEIKFKNVNLIENGAEVLHDSASELEFSKLSMNERVIQNLRKLRAKKLEWEESRRNILLEYLEVDIPYEVWPDGFDNQADYEASRVHEPPLGFKFDRLLQIAMRGDDVEYLQKILEELGYYEFEEGPTGYFGEITRKALIDFQIDNALAPFPGTLGPKTRELLNNEYLYLLW
jgi:hypothetical protein